ncbi:ATP-dependent helicase/nuclease subunit A [Ruegeria denitrificans]|uniref:DNA 3'-5' helicase n=1 Tax=Ruegeria denitrificans TaxID=1715692 RepID=A0A0P1I0S5_9RHOB|nr:UvrD-helicase domain-containing protein [Ruegeria denitrificans]CUJ83480.1 ATP-dependent helicase/nuclease subunit A [Ruegeria denitrificans]
MTDHLTLVPAGAGAGKTTRIQNTLADWIETDQVKPGRILAVTFSEAAASELRMRIRAELMKRGRVEDALEIDRAYVGTIHSLGQRLLTEHAFAAGRSPQSRLLSEAERDILIRLEMAYCQALEPIMQDLGRYGYKWSFLSGENAESALRSDLLRTVDLLRGLGRSGMSNALCKTAIQRLENGYGACAADGSSLTSTLQDAAKDLLLAFPSSLAPDAGNQSAQKDFARDFANLRRAANTDDLERDWSLWHALRDLRLSKRTSPTPDGYDAYAATVMKAADALLQHPGPLEDAKTHLTALVSGAQQVLASYDAAKRQAGLIDYADMIVEAETLLRDREDILAAVLSEVDCVVIDEFQDTNPVQFSLLWRLAKGAQRALIVGDTKQSIMGFQGADSRLSEALQKSFPDNVDPLNKNWRSDARIMGFVNELGRVLFPESYDALSPTQDETGETAIEAIVLPRSWADRKKHAPDCVADRVFEILEGNERVRDKHTKKLRSVRPSDVAVLCYTTAECARMADALRKRSLPVRIQGEGWLEAPATRAARAAVAFVSDPADRHAALTWLTLGPPAVALEDALASSVSGKLDTDTALEALHKLQPLANELPVGDLIAEIIIATGLRDWAAGLSDPLEALADLTRFQAEAGEFDQLAQDMRAAAGFHGFGPQVFLGWISAQTEKDWNRHPDPAGWSGTGVEISTWHAAKGREWHITVVAGLEFKFPERPGTLSADFSSFDDLDNVLNQAGLSWLPNFAAPEKQKVFADDLIEKDERDAARELYVAMTRARDRLIVSLPAEPSKEKDRPERMVDLLRARSGLDVSGASLMVSGSEVDARIIYEAPDREFPEAGAVNQASVPRFGQSRVAPVASRTPWRVSPSSLETEAKTIPPMLRHFELGHGLGVRADHFNSATERGTAWHLAFRVLCQRPDLRNRLAATVGLDSVALDTIAAQIESVRAWLKDQGYEHLHFELPIQDVRTDGSQTNAIIDCLAEGPSGYLILDHKSGPCPDPSTRFANYLPQLRAYTELLSASGGKPVRQLAINWMNEGMISVAHVAHETAVCA